LGNSIVDEAIEFVASQGSSHSNSKDGDSVCMETQRQERIDALEKLVNQQDRTIKLLNARLNFVMSMLGISDDSSHSHKEIIDLDNNEEFPYMSAIITKDPNTKSMSTSDSSIPPASKSMSITSRSSVKDAHNVFSNAVMKAVYHENQIKDGRSKCVVVSGLPVRYDQFDTTSVKQLCSKELQIDVNIVQCKRLGTEATSSPSKIRPILVTLSTTDQANHLVSCAKKLRRSSDKAVRSGVYINRFMTKAESQVAYVLRCKRRSTTQTNTVATSSAFSNYQSENKNVLTSNVNTVETLLSSSTSSSASAATTNPTPTTQLAPGVHSSMLNPNAIVFTLGDAAEPHGTKKVDTSD